MKTKSLFLLCFIILHSSFILSTLAQGTAFTYQGRLTDNGGPANGANDFTFTLYDAASGGATVGVSNVVNDLAVTNGLFTVPFDFGAAFDGSARWLQIAVRPGASAGAYTNLIPRQPITATPYAIRALTAGSANTAAGVTAGAVNNLALAADAVDGAKILNGAITSADLNASLLNGTFWNLGGNAGTTPGAQFLGTSDNQPLELKVNGARALRLEPTAGAPNVIGGAANNVITAPSAGGGVLSGSGHRIFNASDYSVIAGGFSNRIQISSPGGFIGGGQFNWIVNSSTNSVIGGGAFNQITDPHSFIGGGLHQTNRSAFAFIGGGQENLVDTDSDYSAIGGGRDNAIAANSLYATIAGGYLNDIGTNSDYSAISGGINNNIAANALYATIAGGGANDIATSSDYSTISGGRANNIAADSLYAIIAGGYLNDIGTNSDYSTIGGGNTNTIATNSQYATIGGGRDNIASDSYATVPGGRGNIASGFGSTAMGYYCRASGAFSTALGSTTASADYSTAMGFGNTATAWYATAMGYLSEASGQTSTAMGSSTASGDASTAMGGSTASGQTSTAMGSLTTASGDYSTAMGRETTASGDYSTAMGHRANAIHSGSFVWADDQNADFFSLAANQFALRASGGVRFSDDTPHLSFGSSTREMIRLYGSDYTIGVQSSCLYQRSNADFSWFQGGVHSDTRNSPGAGGVEMMRLRTTGLTVNGAFLGASDRNLKENFKPVDPRAVLDKVAALPLSEWNYKADTASRHVGPMAQDFYAAFGVGPDDKHIATVDADGVALAAIQGLNQKVETSSQKSEDRIQKLETENAKLKQRLEKLEQLMNQNHRGAQ